MRTQRWQRNTVRSRGRAPRFRRRARRACGSPATSCAGTASGARPSSPRGRPASRAYSVAAGALAWGAAAGWSDAAFRVYYLGGALLTAALLGVGSLLLVGRRWVAPVALVYVGARDRHRDRGPAARRRSPERRSPRRRTCSTCGPRGSSRSSATPLGTLAVVGVAARARSASRPVGNALILAGIAVAGIGSGLAGLGVGALAPAIAVAAVLLYAGFVAPATLAKPRPPEHADHDAGRSTTRRSPRGRHRARLATGKQPHPSSGVEHHQRRASGAAPRARAPVVEHRDGAIVRDREPGDVADTSAPDLDVPDRLWRHDREVRREVDGPEEIPATPERVRDRAG